MEILSMTRPAVFLTLTLLAAHIAAPATRAGERRDSLEYPVKASLLLNFAKFTQWPEGSPQAAAASVAICVLGPDPFGGVLDATVEGRTVGGRPIEVKRYRQVDGIETCHVLFVASPDERRMAEVFARVGDAPVLTVGEAGNFAEQGGVIRLSVEENRARFSVNLAPTEASRLKLSSKLLNVAQAVLGGAGR
jgi:hypothetical protein